VFWVHLFNWEFTSVNDINIQPKVWDPENRTWNDITAGHTARSKINEHLSHLNNEFVHRNKANNTKVQHHPPNYPCGWLGRRNKDVVITLKIHVNHESKGQRGKVFINMKNESRQLADVFRAFGLGDDTEENPRHVQAARWIPNADQTQHEGPVRKDEVWLEGLLRIWDIYYQYQESGAPLPSPDLQRVPEGTYEHRWFFGVHQSTMHTK
jgi:hypothetical protein